MRKGILTPVFILCYIVLHAQYPGYTAIANPAKFREQFASASLKTQSIKADFIQEKNLEMLSEKIVSRGKFWFKKDHLVRMEYTQPFQYLMIINKENIFIKDGKKENKVSTSSSKLFGQVDRIIVDCVQGTALNNPDFSTRVFENNTGFLVELSPTAKGMKAYFKTINIIVGKKDYSVASIEMREPSGDYTIISFTNKELNVNIPDALFVIN
jgi:outer membrane lipoprotein-sorting protein